MNLINEVNVYLNDGFIEKAILAINEFWTQLNTQTRIDLGKVFLKKAQELINDRKYIDAFRLLEHAYKLDKYNKTTSSLLARVYYTKAKHCDNTDEQIRLVKKCLRLDPKLQEARDLLSRKSISINQQKKLLKSSIKQNNDLSSKLKLCNINLKDKKIEEALLTLNTIEYDENNKDIVILFAKVNIIKGNIDEAINELLKIREKVYDVRIELLLCKLYLRIGKYDEAFNFINDIHMKNCNNTYIIEELIKFYLITGNYEHALYVFESNFNKLSDNEGLKNGFIRNTRYYLKHMLGFKNKTAQTYFERQIEYYSEAETLKELYKYADKSHNLSVKPIFKCSILDILNFSKEKIENMIPSEKDLLDTYIIKSDKLIGKVNTITTCTFEVKTISNTKKIVEILPVSDKYAESITTNKNLTYNLNRL